MISSARGAGITLRPAVVEDAESLARCHLTCWREAYSGLVDPDRLAPALAAVDERAERWRQILAGSSGTVLAEDAGAVVGFASVGPQCDDDLDVARTLHALYVLQSHQRLGVGHRLLEGVLGQADCSLWVLATNARARVFYRQHGFVADGTRKVDDLFGPEVRMVRSAAGGGGVLPPAQDG
jgi:GNAT superfamily N-acetyltransferase